MSMKIMDVLHMGKYGIQYLFPHLSLVNMYLPHEEISIVSLYFNYPASTIET